MPLLRHSRSAPPYPPTFASSHASQLLCSVSPSRSSSGAPYAQCVATDAATASLPSFFAAAARRFAAEHGLAVHAGLFHYYKEVSDCKMQLDGGNLSVNGMIGCLLEESSLGLTKLVNEIYEKLKGLEGVSAASFRSSVPLVGQRMMYGKSSLDADVLEDE